MLGLVPYNINHTPGRNVIPSINYMLTSLPSIFPALYFIPLEKQNSKRWIMRRDPEAKLNYLSSTKKKMCMMIIQKAVGL